MPAAKLTKVQIEVISGKNMPETDVAFDPSKFNFKTMGLVAAPADPFVVCSQAGKALFKTKAITDAKNPVWNHKEILDLDRSKGDLTFTVYDEDSGDVLEMVTNREAQSDFIGQCTVPLKSCNSDFGLAPPTASVPGKTKKAPKKKIQPGECSLQVKLVVEDAGCCGGCSIQ
mmetsp:Transcript_72632/g.126093  ORF Transcript_72632/g.126093 Transcript_72632/m.126093 type:complete len:172 (-) Transcript_72632:88-603(-)